MATYTVKIAAVCKGGEHLTVDVYCDARRIQTMTLGRADLMAKPDLNDPRVLAAMLQTTACQAGAVTPSSVKAAVEAVSWVM